MNERNLYSHRSGATMTAVRDARGNTLLHTSMAALIFLLGIVIAIAPHPAGAAGSTGQAFSSPDAAVQALGTAWHSGQTEDLMRIFGRQGRDLVVSGDAVADEHARTRLAELYDEQHHVDDNGKGEAILILGSDEWPYPIPLVRQAGQWRFDSRTGAQRILDRRIGRNELHAIGVCRVYVEAQDEYAGKKLSGAQLEEFAQRLTSTPGKRDGLFWEVEADEPESPLGPLVAAAEARGYQKDVPGTHEAFHGYYFRILTGQSQAAPGGSESYLVDGHMTRGFALIAYPAEYGNSGVMTFIVNQSGVVYEKNLGPRGETVATAMKDFDPDTSWHPVGP